MAPLEGWNGDKVSLITETEVHVYPLIDLDKVQLNETRFSIRVTVSSRGVSRVGCVADIYPGLDRARAEHP